MPEPPDSRARIDAVRRVAREVLTRRSSGIDLTDGEVLDSHPELLPELADELRKLRVIQRGLHMARDTGSSAWTGEPRADASLGTLQLDVPGYEPIGDVLHGGQGVVFRARQEATGRTVAVKLLREGPLASPAERARFDREVHVLAGLQHPGIVAIFDSGAVADRHFLVTDFVDGRPFDQAAREQLSDSAPGALRRNLPVVLGWMIQACDAVHAAHVRGVIHRDLKPANVLVDWTGRVHVLDFGLAKLDREDDDSVETTVTQTGHFVGSLPWASPEQARGDAHAVDARSDVYALGVMLYQALLDEFPYRVRGPIPEVMDRILTAAPGRPRAIQPQLPGELETILLKCLAKEPVRRYQTAGELGRDLERYLAGLPIDARRDSTWYVLRKLAARHRVAAGFGLAMVVLLAVTSVSMALSADRARRAERAAEADRAIAERVSGFLQGMFAAADPFGAEGRGADVRVRDVLDDAAVRAAHELADQPEVLAAVRATIGMTYLGLGLYPQAERELTAALAARRDLFGPRDRRVAESQQQLAELLQVRRRYDDAVRLATEAVDTFAGHFGDRDARTVSSRIRLALILRDAGELESAEAHAQNALAGADEGDDGPLRAKALHAIGAVHASRGRYADAEEHYARAAERWRAVYGDAHPELATSLSDRATALYELGAFAEAEACLSEALVIAERRFPGAHPFQARVLSNLGSVRRAMDDVPGAEAAYRRALDIQRAVLGPENPDVALTLRHLGSLLAAQGKTEDARRLLEGALACCEDAPLDAAPLAAVHDTLGALEHTVGNLGAAREHFRASLALRDEALPLDHPDRLDGLRNLAVVELSLGDHVAAAALLEECVRLQSAADVSARLAAAMLSLGDAQAADGATTAAVDTFESAVALFEPGGNDAMLARALEGLAAAAAKLEDLPRADAAYARAVELRRALLADDPVNCTNYIANYALYLKRTGRFDAAIELYREVLDTRLDMLDPDDIAIGYAQTNLARALDAAGDDDQAATVYAGAVDALTQASAAARITATVRSHYGACLLRLDRLEEAERELLSAFETLRAERGLADDATRTAARRLATVYHALDRPAEAAAYAAFAREP